MTHFPIDPSVFSLGIWNDLEARHTAKKVLDMVQLDLKKQSGRSDNSQNSRSWNSNQNSSFHPHKTSASDNTKTGRCIFCGDRTKSHYSHNCTASYNTSGAPCHLHRVEPASTRQSKTGNRYCYSWNGLSGCNKGSSCLKGEHLCSLCGSSSHIAQQCNIVA